MSRKYTITNIVLKEGKNYAAACNSIGFINQGNTIVKIQGLVINPGQSWSPTEGLPGEIDATNYQIEFDEAGASAPITNYLVVSRKTYIE